jgi:hypothetical protein
VNIFDCKDIPIVQKASNENPPEKVLGELYWLLERELPKSQKKEKWKNPELLHPSF